MVDQLNSHTPVGAELVNLSHTCIIFVVVHAFVVPVTINLLSDYS